MLAPEELPAPAVTPWRGWWEVKRGRDADLAAAAGRGDLAAVRAALDAPDGGPTASAAARLPHGRRALHAAAGGGWGDVVVALLRARADAAAQADDGASALHEASGRGHAEVARQLLAAGADPLAETAEGNLAVHLAALGGHVAAMEVLLGSGDGAAEQLHKRNRAGQLPAEASTHPEALRVCAAHDDRHHGDRYASRVPLEVSGAGALLLQSSRSDHVRRLLHKVQRLPDSAPAPDTAADDAAGPRRAPRRDGATPRTPADASAPRSFGAPSPSPRHMRPPFVRMRTDGGPAVEKVGPNSFELVRLIGGGSFGKVYKVKHKRTGEAYAMKVLEKSKIVGKNLQRYAMTERNILAYTRHPYIVRLQYAFQTASHLVLVLQFCPNGSLQQLITRERRLQEPIARLYTAEILLALCHLHERKTVFRDLKPDNVVLDEEYHAMLTDFGLSKEGVGALGTTSFCGSVAFLAPEILLRKEHGHTVDVYDLGVLLFDMLTGLPPFYHHDRETLFANIRHARLEVPKYVNKPAKMLIEALMLREPSRRLGARRTEDIRNHPFFAGLDFEALALRAVPLPGPLPVSFAGAPDARGAAAPPRSGRRAASQSPYTRLGRGGQAISGWEYAAISPLGSGDANAGVTQVPPENGGDSSIRLRCGWSWFWRPAQLGLADVAASE